MGVHNNLFTHFSWIHSFFLPAPLPLPSLPLLFTLLSACIPLPFLLLQQPLPLLPLPEVVEGRKKEQIQ
jgi:hypothetical protein